MAAAVLARSRGVAVFSITKGLFLMSTLLCLICLSTSLINKNQLFQEVLKESYKEAQQEMDELMECKSDMLKASELVDEYLALMDPMIAVIKKIDTLVGETDPDTDMEDLKVSMEETKAELDSTNEELDEEIASMEKKLRTIKTLIENVGEQHTEL
ncbi:unnamed protein product [Oreochromis niloticus]|nr:unnamed protein product [Mustela putorius furo]